MKTQQSLQIILLTLAAVCVIPTTHAEDFKWDQTTSGTYTWDEPGNWLPDVPVNSTHADNLYFLEELELADGTNIVANNDLADPTLTQDLRLMGTGPAGGAATFDITGNAIRVGGDGDRPVRLVGDNGGDGTLSYNIYCDIQGTHAITFINDGTAIFNFYGQLKPRLGSTGDLGVLKQGTSTIRLHTSQSFNDREFNHVAGKVELVGGAELTSNLRFLLRESILAVSGADSSVNILENNAGIGTLQIAPGLALNITTAQAVSNLINEDANRVRVTSGGTLRATHATTPATFTAPLHLEGSTLELTRNNNWADIQPLYMQDGASLVTGGFDNTFDRLELRGGESFIDFGTDAADSLISFGDGSTSVWAADSTLTVLNWQGFLTPTSGDSGEEYLRFSNLTSDQLKQIRFLTSHGFAEGYHAAQSIEIDGFSYIIPLP